MRHPPTHGKQNGLRNLTAHIGLAETSHQFLVQHLVVGDIGTRNASVGLPAGMSQVA